MDAAITALEENIAEEVVVDGPMVLNGLTKFCAALKKNTAVRRLSLRDTKTKGATMIALGVIVAFLRRWGRGSRLLTVALSLVAGGAIGNLVERHRLVVDPVRGSSSLEDR